MNKFFINIVLIVLTSLLYTCKNSIDHEIEESKCEVAISNLRVENTKMNDQLYLINGDSVYPRQLYNFYFDYEGDCLDSNAYFQVDYLGFYPIDSDFNDSVDVYSPLGSGQLIYNYNPISVVDLGGKIRFGIAFIFNSTETFQISVKGFYNGYEPATGYLKKETNQLNISVKKIDEMQ